MKLTKLGKIVFTVLTIIVSVMVYSLTSNLANIVSDRNLMEVLAVASWAWLLAGQFIIYSMIWK